jgi:hypothetical protein
LVHDEFESLQKQAIIDPGKFVAHDLAMEGVGAVALKATEGVAAITLYLGIGSIIDAITGVGNPPTPINVTAINNNNSSILDYINNYTRYSFLSANGLDVSGFTTLNNNTTLLSSLNVSGFTTLNDNTTLLSSLNISGFGKLARIF